MNPKYRAVYLLGGVIGLLVLAYVTYVTYPFINAGYTLFITVPSMVFFYLAYKTYPVEVKAQPQRSRNAA